jgi:hypothetical protein
VPGGAQQQPGRPGEPGSRLQWLGRCHCASQIRAPGFGGWHGPGGIGEAGLRAPLPGIRENRSAELRVSPSPSIQRSSIIHGMGSSCHPLPMAKDQKSWLQAAHLEQAPRPPGGLVQYKLRPPHTICLPLPLPLPPRRPLALESRKDVSLGVEHHLMQRQEVSGREEQVQILERLGLRTPKLAPQPT